MRDLESVAMPITIDKSYNIYNIIIIIIIMYTIIIVTIITFTTEIYDIDSVFTHCRSQYTQTNTPYDWIYKMDDDVL